VLIGSLVSDYLSYLVFYLKIFYCFDQILYFQGSVVAMSTFYPLDTVRSRLQCKWF
jgi:hypothetical protein